MAWFEKLDFNEIGDDRGSLVALESFSNIPFQISRVYYIYNNLSNIERGFHAHKRLRQVAICLNGEVDILMDNGTQTSVITLNSPTEGLVIDSMQWHEMRNFSEGAILMVLADGAYDELDYIRNYEDFKILLENSDDTCS